MCLSVRVLFYPVFVLVPIIPHCFYTQSEGSRERVYFFVSCVFIGPYSIAFTQSADWLVSGSHYIHICMYIRRIYPKYMRVYTYMLVRL